MAPTFITVGILVAGLVVWFAAEAYAKTKPNVLYTAPEIPMGRVVVMPKFKKYVEEGDGS